MLQPGVVQLSGQIKAISPCVEPRRAKRHVGEGAQPPAAGVPGARHPGAKSKRLLCLEVYILRFSAFAVATLLLAKYLFSGAIERQAFSHVTQMLLTMSLNCLFPAPPPIIQQGIIDLENIKCSFLAKLCKWRAYIFWSPLSLLSC